MCSRMKFISVYVEQMFCYVELKSLIISAIRSPTPVTKLLYMPVVLQLNYFDISGSFE